MTGAGPEKDPTLLVSGREFARRGARGVGAVMEELIAGATSELHVLAYVIAPSARPLLTSLEVALGRGVRVTLVVNVIAGERVVMAPELLELARQHPHATVRFFDGATYGALHAKVLVADRQQAVVGSANYTGAALTFNHEIGVLLEGRPAWDLAGLADQIAASPGALVAPR